jgi:hypothetical protein
VQRDGSGLARVFSEDQQGRTLVSIRVALSLALIATFACDQVKGPDGDDLSLTGVVTRIDDQVPVDGGVQIDLTLGDGSTEVVYMPSLFTFPPPPPERQEIYSQIQKLRIGSRVRVEGTRTELGVEIEEMEILTP